MQNIDDDDKSGQEGKKVCFDDDVKFKMPHADTLTSTQEADMMCNITRQSLKNKSQKNKKYMDGQFGYIMSHHQ